MDKSLAISSQISPPVDVQNAINGSSMVHSAKARVQKNGREILQQPSAIANGPSQNYYRAATTVSPKRLAAATNRLYLSPRWGTRNEERHHAASLRVAEAPGYPLFCSAKALPAL